MFLQRSISFKVIVQFAWKVQLYALGVSGAAYIAYHFYGLKSIAIPFLPVATIGTAVAFYVGFKNNSAYDRLWEGRRIWGSITNCSRMWAAMVVDVVASREEISMQAEEIKRNLLYRHLAWMNMLRLQLRRNPVFSETEYTSSTQLKIIKRTHGEHKYEHQVYEVFNKFLSEEDQKKQHTKAMWLLIFCNSKTQLSCNVKIGVGWMDMSTAT